LWLVIIFGIALVGWPKREPPAENRFLGLPLDCCDLAGLIFLRLVVSFVVKDDSSIDKGSWVFWAGLIGQFLALIWYMTYVWLNVQTPAQSPNRVQMQDRATQIGYWDRVAPAKRFSHPLRQDWLAQFSRREARILGLWMWLWPARLPSFSEAGFRNLVGVDFSQAMLERAP
jgi:hypothetical protein